MMISTNRKLTGREFIEEMKREYNSIDDLEELVSNTNDMKMYVDLRNWKYYRNHLDEEIEITQTVISQNH